MIRKRNFNRGCVSSLWKGFSVINYIFDLWIENYITIFVNVGLFGHFETVTNIRNG
jgi:hypothetical protein